MRLKRSVEVAERSYVLRLIEIRVLNEELYS